MKVEIWSDVACPWCYLGKHRFESALDQFAHKDQVEITWRSFELAPDAPAISDISVNQMLMKKYGMTMEQSLATNERMTALGAQDGIEFHLEKAQYGNTFDAHRLLHLAAKHNLQDAAKERLFKAYFSEGAAIGDTETLVKAVSEVNIDADEARAVLNSDAFADEVRADEQRARTFGIQGVPFFAIDEKYGISGAQPTSAFKQVLDQVWAESHPLIKIGGNNPEVGTCDDETCAI